MLRKCMPSFSYYAYVLRMSRWSEKLVYLLKQRFFARFIKFWKKQILATVIEKRKEIKG